MTQIELAIEDFFVRRKFGIFVHWGLYSLLGGIWKGRKTPYIGEWIMKRCEIPASEYEKLAPRFRPTSFHPDQWIEAVERSGAKYVVFTAKHHDGFAMYHSRASGYNIIDASGYSMDPVAELARACEKRGIKFCLYYSQDQDWHHPHGTGNDWDYDESKKDFSIYFNEKVKPQVTELLSNYGPIGLIWFDTPASISREHSQELFELVHQLQPACLVNGRLGHGIGDYAQTEDNDLPAGISNDYWEIPATMNDTWGYKVHDENWKSPEILLRYLVEAVSKGGNYLLNLGPDGEGVIPAASLERLKIIGNWLQTNGEAIFEAGPSPFLENFPWGHVTSKQERLYLNLIENLPEEIVITGLKSKVKNISVVGNGSECVVFDQKCDADENVFELTARVPEAAGENHSCVLAVEIEGVTEVDNSITQQPDGRITLEAYRGDIANADEQKAAALGKLSSIEGWHSPESSITWKFRLRHPGVYELSLLTAAMRKDGDPATPVEWEGGHRVKIEIGDKSLEAVIEENFVSLAKGSYAKYIGSRLGQLNFEKAGEYEVKLTARQICAAKELGLTLRSIGLNPIRVPAC